MKIKIAGRAVELGISDIYTVESRDKKLTKNSPQAAKFHRGMRGWHKKQMSMHRAKMKSCEKDSPKMEVHKTNCAMHKNCAMEHNAKYKACMK